MVSFLTQNLSLSNVSANLSKMLKELCVLVILFTAILCEMDTPSGPCECAAFDNTMAKETDQPIIKNHPINVTCDNDGEETCTKLCTALVQAAKERGPILICAAVPHTDGLKASAYTRICNKPIWTYTGLTSKELLCCHDGKPKPCDQNQ